MMVVCKAACPSEEVGIFFCAGAVLMHTHEWEVLETRNPKP